MATYTDPKGKDWPIEFSNANLGEIQDVLSLDLTDPTDRERLQDPGTLLEVAKILCREQLAACRILPRTFRKRIRATAEDLRLAIEQAADDWQTEPVIDLELTENEPLMEE